MKKKLYISDTKKLAHFQYAKCVLNRFKFLIKFIGVYFFFCIVNNYCCIVKHYCCIDTVSHILSKILYHFNSFDINIKKLKKEETTILEISSLFSRKSNTNILQDCISSRYSNSSDH